MAPKHTTDLPGGGDFAEDALTGEATPPRTGDQTPNGQNPNRPAIGSLGGYAPDSPLEAAGGKTSTIIEDTERPLADVLDETDLDYLDEYLHPDSLEQENNRT
jgi:hypothetical protein